MKNCYFKKLALLLAIFVPLVLQAQQPPQPCHIVITGDFESQCLLPTDKDSFYVENGDMLIACQGMRVTYTASVNTGGITVTNWKWNVVGAATWNDNYNGTVTVEWGSGNVGQLTVEVSTAIGTTCTKTVKVQLIESPTVASSSTPAYIVNPDGSKTLYVCKDESVDFTDLSTTTNIDIAGYYWESTQGGSASTHNYHVESFANYDDVVHRVYNNCGCYSEEVIHIEILYGDTLDLGCYGTVCEGSIVTYTANNLPCSNYYWYVEGGTIQDGQGTQQVTVQWGAPADGYGVIGIDGDLCGNGACPTMLSKKIPVISDHLAIKGQHTACVGESVVYSLPLFGSTSYQWSVTPTSGAVPMSVNGTNEWMYTFTNPGTYYISVIYNCDFLECGEFKTEPFVVVVKPKLAITGEDRICVSNACQLATEPNISANWKVQYIDNNYQQVYTTTGSSLTRTFSEIIQVNPTPAAPTVSFGSNACIDNPPVELVGSSAVTSDLHWSNGDVGTYANYYTPGIATSWYYHPVTGCKSATASIFIEPEPNFDALLTGCYERCKDFLTTHNSLPVWGLYAGREPIDWYWWLNTNYIDNGIQNAPNYTLRLPIVSPGDYWLDVKYNSNNCHVSSPHFVVNVADTCECEGWDISTSCSTYVNRCRLYYDVTVTICNNSSYDACVDDLFPLFDLNNYRISNSTFTGQLVAPSHCYSFTMTIEALRMVPLESILFRILDKCNGCTKDFSIDLSLGKFECYDTMRVQGFNIPLVMESDAAAYIDFLVDFSYVQNVLAFWVDPPMLFNYTYDSFSGLLRGLYMMDRGVLSRLAMEGGDVCFYAITCNNDKLCLREYCIAASVLHQLLSWRRIQPEVVSDSIFDSDSVHTKSAKSQAMSEPTLLLVPNPTAGEVQVMGAAGEVSEVLVLDMKGRQVAKFEHTDRFDISGLPSGAYIVRLRTRSGEDANDITYLKLVKE